MSSSSKPILKIFDSDTIVSEKVCEFVTEIANKAIKERGIFTVGLSGMFQSFLGSTYQF